MCGRFPEKLGPKTAPDGPGSKNAAAHTYSQPLRAMVMPFCDIVLLDAKNYNLKSGLSEGN